MFATDLPRSAYVHVPFCRHRCGYCNFSVIADRDDLVDRFLSAIEIEIHQQITNLDEPPVLDTLFVGGGTPTHLATADLEQFLDLLHQCFRFSDQLEWTMEANPEDITDEKLELMRSRGVNRLSLGVQSFNDRKLKLLERGHGGMSAASVIQRASTVFENLSIDLIFGAPEESLSEWEADLRMVCSLPITHVSTYALTFEKGTSFWNRKRRGDLNAVDETVEIAMYDSARHQFADVDLEHYEISNFSHGGQRCRHNLAYWKGLDWYAFGPGAAAFRNQERSVNHRSTTAYLKRIESGKSPIQESELVSKEQLAREAAAFGVRLIDGIDLDEIKTRWNIDIQSLCAEEIQRLGSQDLIHHDGSLVQLTQRGIHFADSVASEFLG